MTNIHEYKTFETAWCPGCGDFSILESLKGALYVVELKPHVVFIVGGLGQGGETPPDINSKGI